MSYCAESCMVKVQAVLLGSNYSQFFFHRESTIYQGLKAYSVNEKDHRNTFCSLG